MFELPGLIIKGKTYDSFPDQEARKAIENLGSGKAVTYAQLKELRDNSELIPGMYYRITDYRCTTSQANTVAANNQFDIIVLALAKDTLSEHAYADYCTSTDPVTTSTLSINEFNANPSAWEIKYCLDNDINRFAWALDTLAITNLDTPWSGGECLVRQPTCDRNVQEASYRYAWGTTADVEDGDSTNFWYSSSEFVQSRDILYDYDGRASDPIEVISGKGVIYYMKDEHDNECHYDFKNIMFKRDETWQDDHSDFINRLGVTNCPEWFYTFSWVNENSEVEDLTLRQDLSDGDATIYGTKSNSIGNCYTENNTRALPNTLFISSADYDYSSFYGCYNNILGSSCYNNTFGNECYNNTFGNECSDNICGNGYNDSVLGDYCNENTFGEYCYNNTFGNYCYGNTFGEYCNDNTFGIACCDNIFGNYCYSNIFGDCCYENTFGDECCVNTFGNYCDYNIFGNYCYSNIFGNYCYNNTFGTAVSPMEDVNGVHFEANCSFISLLDAETANTSGVIRDITVLSGVRGTDDVVKELQVTRDAAPVIFEASGTTHIILDQEK